MASTLTLTRCSFAAPTLSLTAHVLLQAVLLPWRCNRDELLLLVRSKENAGGAHSAQTRPRPASLLISLFANARSAPSEPMFGRKSSPSVLKERHQKHGSYLRP